jgi:anti-sigma regulatory factor (Ser/Thr protein kinase)
MSIESRVRRGGVPVPGGTADELGATQMAQSPPVVLRFPALPESIPKARHAVARFVDALGAGESDIELAVSEAMTNAVEHAYRGTDRGVIELCLEILVPNTLVVSVNDDGTGMGPDPDGAGLGMGLALIGRLTSGFEVLPRQDHGTRVRMRFQLDKSPSFNPGFSGVGNVMRGATAPVTSRSSRIARSSAS